MSYLTNQEVITIEQKYGSRIVDDLLQKKRDNLEKTSKWISTKNNNKTNKFKKKNTNLYFRKDPYKFIAIPKDIRNIILKECKKIDITLQTLAVRCNLPLHMIDNFIHNNYTLDNYELDIILKYLGLDLIELIEKNKKENEENEEI